MNMSIQLPHYFLYLLGRSPHQAVAKIVEVLEETHWGTLLIDEACTLGMSTKRTKALAGNDAIAY